LNQRKLAAHLDKLAVCKRCPLMQKPVVTGNPVMSTMFRWFEEHCGMDEATFRTSIYMAAVCRCFPGKNAGGGDRVPNRQEIANCSDWIEAEMHILKPLLVIPVGKLAIAQFIAPGKLAEIIGRQFGVNYRGHTIDLVPLPHPSGASPWHRIEPGKTLLRRAMKLIRDHPAFREPSVRVMREQRKTTGSQKI
jgi:uracil-DNA glycosylase